MLGHYTKSPFCSKALQRYDVLGNFAIDEEIILFIFSIFVTNNNNPTTNDFIFMARHNLLGALGEKAATEFLIKYGYTIRESNWRCDRLEIDIVAEHQNRLIIVEVKTRSSDFVLPTESVDRKKISNLVRAANAYIKMNNLPHEVQFDILTLVGTPENFEIEHIPDAFLPSLKTYR